MTGSRTFIITLITFMVIGAKGIGVNDIENLSVYGERQLPAYKLNDDNLCPDEEDIAPCICTANISISGDFKQEMRCANISDNDELARIFQSPMPVKNFTFLYLYESDISVLLNGVFSDVTFEEVEIQCHSLKTIGEDVFINMWPMLRQLNIYNGLLEEFPYKTVFYSESLVSLNVFRNNISVLYELDNPNLEWISISHNPITELPKGVYKRLHSLTEFQISYTNITEFPQDFLYGNDVLNWIDLSCNSITHISSGTFNITSPNLSLIDLGHNQIETVDVDAFAFQVPRNGWFSLNLIFNNITELPEEVWHPLLDQDFHLDLFENNLACGCDITWLVLDDSLLEQVNRAYCYNGTLIEELDKNYFLENC